MPTETKPTPRTDAEYWRNYPNGTDGWDFARMLELEHADLLAALERMVRDHDEMTAAGFGVREDADHARAALAHAKGEA